MIDGGLARHDDQHEVAADAPSVAPRRSSRWQGFVQGAGIVVLWLGVMIVVSWPLATAMWDHHLLSWFGLPFDLYQGTWAMAWQTDVLSGRTPGTLADANIYFPARGALFYGQTGWGALPLFAPVYLLTRNPTLAINLTFLLGMALTAAGVHLVVRRWTGSWAAGAVAAATLLSTPWLSTLFVPTAPQLAALMWLPWIAALATVRPFAGRHAVVLVLLLVLQSLTDVVYLMPAVFAAVGVQALARLLRRPTRMDGLWLTGALVVSAAMIVPLLLPYREVTAANPDLANQTNWSNQLIAPLPFSAAHPISVAPVTAYLVVLGLVALALRRDDESRATPSGAWTTAVTWLVVGAVISLPATTKIGGLDGWQVPTPQWLLRELMPSSGAMRASGRLAVVAMIAVALLAGLAFAEVQRQLQQRLGERSLVAMVTTLVVVLYGATLVDSTASRSIQGWPRLLREAPDVPRQFEPFLRLGRPVLHLPIGERDGQPHLHSIAMYRSIGRWYPMLNGYASYWPKAFPSYMRLARRFPDPDAIAALAKRTKLGTVWVDFGHIPPRERKRWERLMGRGGHGLMKVAMAGANVLYLVTPRR